MMHLYAPIQKSSINVAKRTVTGIAQVEEDLPDHQNDVVDFEASKRAFAKWGGNVREMHGRKAVGTCLAWRANPVKKSISVTLKISKGAEDTWQKVLDGTLSALSIGGHELAALRAIHKTTGRSYKRITDYALTELSLVDSPANPQCVITAIHKSRATDVLDSIQGGTNMPKTRKAHQAIRTIAKTLGDNDDLIIVKKSDIENTRADGLFVLKKTATFQQISKDDADDGGYTSDADNVDPGDGAGGGIDWEDHASDAAGMHKDMCTAAGIDDHVGHYQDATQGDDDQDGDDDGSGDGSGAPADMAMSRRTGNLRKNRRNGRSSPDINRLIEKAVGNALGPIAKALEDMKSQITNGGTPAPRKGGDGAPIIKTIGDHLGAKPGETNGDSEPGGIAARYEDLTKSHAELNTRAQAIISKSDAGHRLTPEEDVERINLGKQMGRVEVELGELRRAAAGV